MFAPTTFGKYFLAEKLAAGGMAEIYKAKLLGPGGFEKQLIIKQIKPELARRREFVELFVDEAKVTVQLSHGNIVPVYELGMIDGVYFIAMEYVDGPALSELMRASRKQSRPLEPPLAVHIAVEILKGLDYAHRQRILHRDLSPGNVLLSRAGEVKIVDFGLATSAARLAEGKLVGSYAYMSPEQAVAATLDARTDLFSCGILLWEMLTAQPLFLAASDQETLTRVKTAQVAPPSQLAPAVVPALDAIVLRALARDPRDRYGRAAEFQADLVRLLYAHGTLPQQDDVGRFVRELCPPPPDETAASQRKLADATPLLGAAALQAAVRPKTEVSFATNVAFEKEVLTRIGRETPAIGSAAQTRALASARRGSRAVWVALAAMVVVVGGSAAVIARKDRAQPRELPRPAPASQAVAAQPPLPSDQPEPPLFRKPSRSPAHATRAAPAEPPAAARTGTLTLNATPWADFYLDGRKLPGCPVIGYTAAGGPHAVRVVCPDRQERTESVLVTPGAAQKRVFDCNQSGIPVVAP